MEEPGTPDLGKGEKVRGVGLFISFSQEFRSRNGRITHLQTCLGCGFEKLVIPRAFGSKLVRLFAQGFPPKLAKFAQGFPNLDNNSQGHSTS